MRGREGWIEHPEMHEEKRKKRVRGGRESTFVVRNLTNVDGNI